MKLKLEINDKVGKALKGILNLGKKALDVAIDYGTAAALLLILGFSVLKLPEMHRLYLRHHVGNKTNMIRDSLKSGGGTGFAVKGSSGESYIMTNDHVCGVSKDKQTVLVTGEDGESIRRNIIAHDENSDLCLIEGLPGVNGLDVARSGPGRGETINVVGHPKLMPLHIAEGEITGLQTIQVPLGVISVSNPETGEEAQIPPEQGGILPEQCMMAKHRQVSMDLDLGFFSLKVKVCLEEIKDAYVSSAVIYPGNSGSPVVNFWGNVTGVAFAGDDTHYGRLINIDDIKAFLKNY